MKLKWLRRAVTVLMAGVIVGTSAGVAPGGAARGSERARAIASSAEPACAAQVADATRPARASEGARAEAASTPGDSNA